MCTASLQDCATGDSDWLMHVKSSVSLQELMFTSHWSFHHIPIRLFFYSHTHLHSLSPFSASLEDVLYPEGKSRCESVCFLCVYTCVWSCLCACLALVLHDVSMLFGFFFLFRSVASHSFPVSFCLPCIFSSLCNDLCSSCNYLSFMIVAMLYY